MPSDYPANPPPPSSRIAAKPTSADCPRRLWHPNNRPAVYSWAFVPQRGCNIAKAAWRQPCRRFPLSPAAGRFAAAGGGRCCRWTRGHQDRSVLRPILVAGGAGGRCPAVSVHMPTRRHRDNGRRPGVLRHRPNNSSLVGTASEAVVGCSWKAGRLSGMAEFSRQEVRSNKAAKMAGRRFMIFRSDKRFEKTAGGRKPINGGRLKIRFQTTFAYGKCLTSHPTHQCPANPSLVSACRR